jgi:hypothetical protein
MKGSHIFLVGSIYFILYGLLPRTYYRKGTRKADPNPGRIRFAFVALGVAMLLLWYSVLYTMN